MNQESRLETGAGREASGGRGLKFGHIGGIGITLDWSLLIIFTLITLVLSGGIFPAWHPQWSDLTVLVTAMAAAVLFLASVLTHELSHALVGRRLGLRIEQITLFVFGGMTHVEEEPRTWRAELGMAIVGPLTSLVLGFVFLYLAGIITGPIEADPEQLAKTLSTLSPLTTILFWLGPVNILLGLFNMVPGFPLDGGRVLRAALWGMTGDLVRATRWAAAFGQGFAWLLIGAGFAMILGVRLPVFGTGPVGGLWIALIGWFLNNAAMMSSRRVVLQQRLGALPVTRVMHRELAQVTPDLSVQDFVDNYLLGSSQRVFPVIEEGQLRGLVCLADVRAIERERRARMRVAEIMTPIARLEALSPSDRASDALDRLARRSVNQLPVVEEGRLLGMVTREDVLRWLTLSR